MNHTYQCTFSKSMEVKQYIKMYSVLEVIVFIISRVSHLEFFLLFKYEKFLRSDKYENITRLCQNVWQFSSNFLLIYLKWFIHISIIKFLFKREFSYIICIHPRNIIKTKTKQNYENRTKFLLQYLINI